MIERSSFGVWTMELVYDTMPKDTKPSNNRTPIGFGESVSISNIGDRSLGVE